MNNNFKPSQNNCAISLKCALGPNKACLGNVGANQAAGASYRGCQSLQSEANHTGPDYEVRLSLRKEDVDDRTDTR